MKSVAEDEARRNVMVLALAQALGGASAPIIISLGGIVGQQLSSDPALVTLPVSLFNLGLALCTLPAAYIMDRFGRRAGYVGGSAIGIAAGLIAAWGIYVSSFAVFCLGTFLAGFHGAYVKSYRFAAADGASGAVATKAISLVMIGGLAAAVIGPQLVIWTRESVPSVPYFGSFLSQSALALAAIPALLMLRRAGATSDKAGPSGGRSLGQFLRMPRYLLAVATGVISHGLMVFVMTAAPVAMVGHGHSISHAALGVQWHVLAMYAPSFVTGHLMARFGKERVTAIGLLVIGISAMVALSGLQVAHFWISLVLLGVGWNFGFIGATAMVTDCHTREERGRAQGANDFIIFGVVAAASFLAGTLLTSSGWQMINWIVLPMVAMVLVPLVWQAKGTSTR